MATLQARGHSVSPYLDDMFITARTERECRQAVVDTAQLLAKLGLCVDVDKSTTAATQVMEHLGYVINTRSMMVTISDSKRGRLQERAAALYDYPTICQVMRFLGMVESCMLGVHAGNLKKFTIEVEKNKALKCHNDDLQANMQLSTLALSLVTWWANDAHEYPRSLILPPISCYLQTDASARGWGACEL